MYKGALSTLGKCAARFLTYLCSETWMILLIARETMISYEAVWVKCNWQM